MGESDDAFGLVLLRGALQKPPSSLRELEPVLATSKIDIFAEVSQAGAWT